MKRQKIETVQDLNKNSEKPDGSSLLIKPFSVPARFADKINIREIKSELIEQFTILNKKPNILNNSLAKSLLEKSIVLKIGSSKIGTSKMRASTIERFTNTDLSNSEKILNIQSTTVSSLKSEFESGLKITEKTNEKIVEKPSSKSTSFKSPVLPINSTDLRASRRLSGRIKREAADKQKFNFSRLRVHSVKTLPMFGGLTAVEGRSSEDSEKKFDAMDLGDDMELKLKMEAIECTSGNNSPSGIMARVRSSKSTNSNSL